MASHQSVTLAPNAWTQVTGSDVSAAMLQNQSGYAIRVLATAGVTPPAATPAVIATGIEFFPGGGFDASRLLSEIFPGITGANRIWAYCSMHGQVVCSHA